MAQKENNYILFYFTRTFKKKMLSHLKTYLIKFIGPCTILVVSMVIFVDQLTIYWLLGFTIYYLYNRRYKDILFIWCLFFIIWYFLFTGLLINFEGKILFNKVWPWDLLDYIDYMYSDRPSLREFCKISVIMLYFLGLTMETTIYIPSFLKGALFVIKMIFGGGKGGD